MARLQRLPDRQQLVAISVELERLQGVLKNEFEDMEAVGFSADPQVHQLQVRLGITSDCILPASLTRRLL